MMGECVTLLTIDASCVLHQVTKRAVSLQQHASAILMNIRLGHYSTIQLATPQVKTV